MGKMEGRKSFQDVRAEKSKAVEKKAAHFAAIAAYDEKYQADAKARREKLAAEGGADKPAEAAAEKPKEG